MNFEDCKKVFRQYLWARISKEELLNWASEHCENCEEKACHCNECPMMHEDNCRFPNENN